MNEDFFIFLTKMIGLLSLLGSLIIFSVIIYTEIKRKKIAFSSHNLFIALLLTCWLIIDFTAPWIFGSESLMEKITHALILIILAVWINIRFFWAHKKARESIDFEIKMQLE
ncbi:MAG: hypothetical protein ACFFAJ_06925 [Candidatus Hodarchaeota archaeon]